MDVTIHGRNMKVSERLKAYALEKLGKLDRYLPNIADIHVELSHASTRSGDIVTAQITLRHKRGAILRAEERLRSNDYDAIQVAINQAVDKMYRQIERFKGKRDRKGRERFTATVEELAIAEEVPEEAVDGAQPAPDPYMEYVEAGLDIVRRKQIAVSEMTEIEAVEQMELLGHDFFMFFNQSTGSVNVLYRRKSGGYGVLVPEVEKESS
jgi:putative sigma-54 modulation protein